MSETAINSLQKFSNLGERVDLPMDAVSNYIRKTFERMDLRQIRAFLFSGGEEVKKLGESHEPYNVRLNNASNPVYERLNSLYPVASELSEATDELSNALSTYQEVYMEIGMKAGARLLYQLLQKDE